MGQKLGIEQPPHPYPQWANLDQAAICLCYSLPYDRVKGVLLPKHTVMGRCPLPWWLSWLAVWMITHLSGLPVTLKVEGLLFKGKGRGRVVFFMPGARSQRIPLLLVFQLDTSCLLAGETWESRHLVSSQRYQLHWQVLCGMWERREELFAKGVAR